jgi:nucleoside-diphosphate-sugar epimerase
MAILITGGSGFVGLALVEASLSAGDEVVAFDRAPPPPALLARIAHPKLTFVDGDVRSSADLGRALAAAPIERVIHAAAITAGSAREAGDPQAIVDVNVGGTACLMAAVKRLRPRVTRVVAMSSASVYGLQDPGPAGHFHEDRTCPAPAALYGITKHAAERTALRLGEVFAIDTRAIRMSAAFGPWEYRTSVRDTISPHLQTIEIAAAGGTAILPRRGAADWIYSRAAAAGIRAVLDARQPRYPVYNLGGRFISDLPVWCESLTSAFPGFSWRLAAAGEAPNVAYGMPRDRAPLDVGRIEEDVGFRNKFDPAHAALDYVQWWREAKS